MTLDERLWKTFNKALGLYQLIDEDDRILVGLSGGKDSLCLLEFLARRSRILKPRFTVEAVHVRMEDIHYETDATYLQSFCSRLNVPLHLITTHFPSPRTAATPLSPLPLATTPDGSPSGFSSVSSPVSSLGSPSGSSLGSPSGSSLGSPSGTKPKPPCFLCSWQRRKQLFNLAQQLGCTKIALGHHQDDIIHTALMNLTFQGHFSTMPAKLRMKKMPLTIIRPLCLCHEDDIRQYAEQQQYQKLIKLCPYETDTHRTSIQQIFQQMRQLNPEARYSIWNALEADGKLTDY